MRPRFLASTAFVFCALAARAQSWPQWGQNGQHSGASAAVGQTLGRILAEVVYDPFVPAEQAEEGGDLIVHYQSTLIDGDDVFLGYKAGRYVPCSPPGAGVPFPCGPDAWSTQIWGERRLHWENGALVEVWRFGSDWKPEPNAGGLGGWEPVFHPALAGNFVYIPGAGGSVYKLNRGDGSVAAAIRPFGGAAANASIFVAGPLTVDGAGAVYYNALGLTIAADPTLAAPWSLDAAGAWLVKIAPDGTAATASFASLTPGAPAANDLCANDLPFPPLPNATPLMRPCGSQRPGLNIAPAIAADGAIYTVSRAHKNAQYAYLVAANADLTPKWAASLRGRLNDGCGVLLGPNGAPGGCRVGAAVGVDPATNQPPAARVNDDGSSSPVVTPDGSVLYGAYTRYNNSRGHLLKFSAAGEFLTSYPFGWDLTPAIYTHDGTYSVILKDNHYPTGSFCNDEAVCPSAPPGPYFIAQLSADLQPEWVFQHTNTQSCARGTDGALHCVSDHPDGFEWCVNAPAVDLNGVVYANSEDGNVYAIGQGGAPLGTLFLQLALGAAYTPIALGPDGKIYAQNDGRLFVAGK